MVVVAKSIMAAGKKGVMEIFYGCIWVSGFIIDTTLSRLAACGKKCKIKKITFLNVITGAKTVKEKRITLDFLSYVVLPRDRNS